MIYLVTTQIELFENENYQIINVNKAIEIISTWDIVQFDTETSGRDAHLCKVLCAQFGHNNTQIVVDTSTIDLCLFKEILETKLLVGVNLKFDYQFLFNYGIIPTKTWDCMIAEQVLYLGYDPKYFHVSLKAIAERRLNIDIDKTTRGEIIWRGLDTKVIQYAAGDVVHLEEIRQQQIEEARIKKVTKAIDLENRFVVCCAYLEWSGIKLDVDKWRKEVIHSNEIKLQEKQFQLDDFVVNLYKTKKDVNINKIFLVKEDNHGYIEEYPFPKDAIPFGNIIKRTEEWGIIRYYRQGKVKSNWNNY